MIATKAVDPGVVASERLHDEEVVELVPLLGEVHLLDRRAHAPPTEGLVQVQHRDVGEVGHARHCLEEPKALDGPLLGVHLVEEEAEQDVGGLDQPVLLLEVVALLLPLQLPLVQLVLVNGQLLQLVGEAHAQLLIIHAPEPVVARVARLVHPPGVRRLLVLGHRRAVLLQRRPLPAEVLQGQVDHVPGSRRLRARVVGARREAVVAKVVVGRLRSGRRFRGAASLVTARSGSIFLLLLTLLPLLVRQGSQDPL
mmetsp:Transcript_878/g.1865  ORF Transcript_878/g.1865 Transcript_878/m.1865 type:complete len:254 (-) Transcript_878:162-923(-)